MRRIGSRLAEVAAPPGVRLNLQAAALTFVRSATDNETLMLTLSNKIFALSAAVLAATSTASAQVRIANYNLAKLGGDPTALRATLAELAFDDGANFVGAFAVAPTVLMFQEVRNADIPTIDAHIVAAYPGIPYTRGTFTTSGTEDGASGAQAMYYRSDKVTEIVSGHMDIATGASRNSDRWLLSLNGYTSTAARFYVYSSHLKASDTAADAATRNTGAIALRANADALGVGQHIIFVGDYNLYTNAEAAYATMTAAGNAQCVDPYGTANWTGVNNAIKHSQSPRDVTGSLVGGGVDDRFDFQFATNEFRDGDGLSYIEGSCHTFGNDGAHYNLAINTGTNSYYPGDIATSNAIADLLFAASDHMPVISDFQVPPIMTVTAPTTFGTVIVGAVVPVAIAVSNSASVVSPIAVDALTATVTGSTGLTGTQAITAALAPAATTVNLAVNTAAAGAVNGTATTTTAVEGTQNPTVVRTVTGTVLAHARASWSAKSLVTNTTVNSAQAANTGVIEIPVSLYNFGFTSLQAKLDSDSASGLTAPFAVVDATEANIAGTPATLRFSINTAGLAAGVYSQTAVVQTSDENLPGATNVSRSITLTVTITSAAEPADLNIDGHVDGADLAMLLNQWGTNGTADLDHDALVGGSDLAILLNAWG